MTETPDQWLDRAEQAADVKRDELLAEAEALMKEAGTGAHIVLPLIATLEKAIEQKGFPGDDLIAARATLMKAKKDWLFR